MIVGKEVKRPFSFLFTSLSSGCLTQGLMPGERCPHFRLTHCRNTVKMMEPAPLILSVSLGSYSDKLFHLCRVYFTPFFWVSRMRAKIWCVIQHRLTSSVQENVRFAQLTRSSLKWQEAVVLKPHTTHDGKGHTAPRLFSWAKLHLIMEQ